MNTHRHIAQLAGACALVAGVAACGSSGGSGNSSPSAPASPSSATSTAPSSSAPATGGPAAATIKTNWETFFNATTPVAKRMSLLQDGSQFPSSSLAATGLAAEANAKVLKVTNVTATSATVSYDILLGTTVALPNQKGTAVYQNGTWKVGVASFCGLLTLENGGKSAGLPAPCKSAG